MIVVPEAYKESDKEYHSAEHIVYSCQYHVVFCPKFRRKVLTEPYDARLKEIFTEIAHNKQFQIMDMEIMPDHVHLLIDCNPRYGIGQCITDLKGISAHKMRSEFPELKTRLPGLWTRSCFVSTVGAVTLDVVKQYIENQKGV